VFKSTRLIQKYYYLKLAVQVWQDLKKDQLTFLKLLQKANDIGT